MAESRMLPPLLLLGALLCAAVWHDLRARRIPNQLVLWGALAGLALQAVLPSGAGLYSTPFGALGLGAGLAGLACGLVLLLPMYALGTLGAGDVKLLAMIGVFLGPRQVLGAALLAMLAGGVLGLGVALYRGELRRVLDNVGAMLVQTLLRGVAGERLAVDGAPGNTGQLPYALAIAAGTILQLLLANNPTWSALI
jgi:prepilin peptidase CpaA